MKVNWIKLRKNIPEKLRAANRKYFSVLWIDNYEDLSGTPLLGGTNFKPKRELLLNPSQSDKTAIHTLWHEYLHAISEEHDVSLTEAQVVKLEQTYQFIREFVLTLEGKK